MLKVYNKHPYEDEKRAALDQWADEVQRIITGESNVVLQAAWGLIQYDDQPHEPELTTYGQVTFPCHTRAAEFSVINRTSRMDGEGAHPSPGSAPADLQERLWCSIGDVCRGA